MTNLHRNSLVWWARGSVFAIAIALLSLVAPPADASDDVATDEPGLAASGAPADQALDLSPGGLLASFHRARRDWRDAGITFRLHEQSEVWANLTGSGSQGLSYNGLTIGKLDLDLDKIFGWSGGEIFIEAFDIHAHGPTRTHVGNLQIVSNAEATPSLKLYDVWLDQSLWDGRLSVRFGQEGANDEFMTSAYDALFLNSSFGFPGMPAADLPSGGPNFPLATPFVRTQIKATDNVTLVAAIFNGDPAPPGSGDPQLRDRNGTAFRLDDHALSVAEIWYSPDPAAVELPTTYKLGGWYSSSHYNDQRFDSLGGLLASPASSGLARSHTGDWAIYGIADQMVWRRAGTKNQGIGVFLQIMAGPGDRNLSNRFFAGGLNWHGMFPQRPDDVFGIAFAYLGISPALQAYGRDLVSFGRAATAYAASETVIEATYQMPVTDWCTLQPDVQIIINPGAGLPGNFGGNKLPNAVVTGIRATIRL